VTFQNRSFLATAVAVLVATTLDGCHREPPPSAPLSPELAAIHCPADRNDHVSTMIGKAQVTFVCVNRQQLLAPAVGPGPSPATSIMRCDSGTAPGSCPDFAEIMLSHDADGLVYSETVPNYAGERENHGPESGPTDDSQLHIIFHGGPPKTHTFDPVETPYRYLLPGGNELLPDGFTFVKGTLCDRNATVLDSGVCNLEATTPSLYWHISISLHHKQGTPMSVREYRTELAFWMKYLSLMVVDPKQ
jgi:hypothetical protein